MAVSRVPQPNTTDSHGTCHAARPIALIRSLPPPAHAITEGHGQYPIAIADENRPPSYLPPHMATAAPEQPPNKRFCLSQAAPRNGPGGEGVGGPNQTPLAMTDDVVGTRVFARGKGGAMFPGMIRAVRYFGNSAVMYCIEFCDGSGAEVHARDIIGEGFRQLAHSRLCVGMAVYVNYNHMLCAGHVVMVNEQKAQVVVELERGDRIRCSMEDVHTECLPAVGDVDFGPMPSIDFPAAHNMATDPANAGRPSSTCPPCTGSSQTNWTMSTYSRADSGISSSAGHISPGLPAFEYCEGPMDSTAMSMTMTYPTPPPALTMWGQANGGMTSLDMRHGSSGVRGRKSVYRCLFMQCGHFLATKPGMRRHVRQCHLGGDQTAPNMVVDHYVAQAYPADVTMTCARPDAMPSAVPWPTLPMVAPPEEALKCRKRYGSDQRELWCTKCRWKKACERVARTGTMLH